MFRFLISATLVLTCLSAGYFILYLPEVSEQKLLISKQRKLQTDINNLQVRLSEAKGDAPTTSFPAGFLWRANSKTDVELALQNHITQAASQFGLSLLTFGSATIKRDATQEAIGFELEAEGSLNDFYAFLASLEETTPPIALGSLRVRPVRNYNEEKTEVTVFLQAMFWVYWEQAK